MQKFHVYRHGDFLVSFSVFALIALGLLFIYSASYHPDGPVSVFATRQLMWAGIGLCLCLAVWKIDYKHFVSSAYLLFAVNIILLLSVLFFGSKTLGAQRWLRFGFFRLQPSEFFKITMILFLAKYYAGLPNYRKGYLYCIIIPFLFIGPAIVLIMKQPDLGTALVLIPVFFALAYIAGTRPVDILYTIIAGVLCAVPGYFLLKPYQQERIKVFLNPEHDPLGVGYQSIQSKIAVGSGGILGKGWLKGTQTQLDFLPERHTDFIFSVIGEEWGFLGTILVIFLFAVLVILAFKIANESRDEKGRLAAGGLGALFLVHLFINAGMTIGIMPITGLPLPFVSYGGSSLITMLVAVGLLQSIYSRRFMF
ncbi:rod shape-determining protein RodA [bacterium]|jgi:rod shape determining protein RodA|nr:rod shape-determining protein RodA [bacterium]